MTSVPKVSSISLAVALLDGIRGRGPASAPRRPSRPRGTRSRRPPCRRDARAAANPMPRSRMSRPSSRSPRRRWPMTIPRRSRIIVTRHLRRQLPWRPCTLRRRRSWLLPRPWSRMEHSVTAPGTWAAAMLARGRITAIGQVMRRRALTAAMATEHRRSPEEPRGIAAREGSRGPDSVAELAADFAEDSAGDDRRRDGCA